MRITCKCVAVLWALLLLILTTSAVAAADLRLVEAAEKRDTQAVRALLTQGVDVNARQADGAAALHWAAHWDDLDTADRLLRAGAVVNAANDFGVTPLSLACLNGSAPMVDRLLAAAANPNAAQSTGETALMTAARTGSVAVVKALLDHGADVNAKSPLRGQTALMWAVSAHHVDVVRVLIEHRADLRASSTGGFTPLLFAAREGDVESTRLLMAAGLSVDETTPNGPHALPLAIASGHDSFAMFLLQNGADANAASGGYAGLHAAVARGSLDLVKALLAHGADPNVRLRTLPPGTFRGGGDGSQATGPRGATPFWLAAAYLHSDLIRALAEAGADPLLATDDKTTPLMVASGVNQNEDYSNWKVSDALEAVKVLVALGADVNAVCDAGFTALHGAAYMGGDSVVQFLVEKNAKLNILDKLQQTPFRIAQGHRGNGATFVQRRTTEELLRNLGADTTLGIDPYVGLRERAQNTPR